MGLRELVKATLDVTILEALAWGPKHGRAVTHRVAGATDGRLDLAGRGR